MTEREDNISRQILRCIDILMLKNPERTVLGLLLGVVLSFLSKLFEPILIKVEYINIANIQYWEWIPFGIVIVHLPYILWSIIRKPFVNDEVDDIIRFIEKSNFSEKEKRIVYRNLVNKCIENITLDDKNYIELDVKE